SVTKPRRTTLFVIWIVVFLFMFASHYVIARGGYLDQSMWREQIEYVEHRDPRSLDFLNAYAHPGTTVVDLGLFLHHIGFSYDVALNAGMAFFTALAFATAVVFAYIISPNSLWWLF